MLQIFLSLAKTLFTAAGKKEQQHPPDEPRDPLDHPALKAMSPRELADIPFPRHRLPFTPRRAHDKGKTT